MGKGSIIAHQFLNRKYSLEFVNFENMGKNSLIIRWQALKKVKLQIFQYTSSNTFISKYIFVVFVK
jgi:hypothetical protein